MTPSTTRLPENRRRHGRGGRRRAISLRDLLAQTPPGACWTRSSRDWPMSRLPKPSARAAPTRTSASRARSTAASPRAAATTVMRQTTSADLAVVEVPAAEVLAAAAAEASAAISAGVWRWVGAAAASARTIGRGRLRRAGDSQRHLGIRQQSYRHRGRDSADHPDGDRSREGERGCEENRRQARAGAAYQTYWATPIVKNPDSIPREDKQEFVQKVVDAVLQEQGRPERERVRAASTTSGSTSRRAKGSYIEQETWMTTPSFNVTARKDDVVRTRSYVGVPKTGGWEVAEAAQMLESAERIAAEAVEFCTAKPVDMGVKDLVLTPSHAMLTIHEIVAHATELDRIMGYEANYAGTSFVKISDIGKLKYGSKLFNVTADRTMPGGLGDGRLRRRRREDDAVPDRAGGHPRRTADQPRDGALHQREGEPRLHLGQLVARLSVPAHAERPRRARRPAGSPTPEEIIADTKDGVLIDGRGSYSIDQQRYNGQFGGNAFWEIKNGKKTRMVSNVTYNAITTDFWGKLDAISGKESWQMFGTGGDAKGQPTQTNSISHGSPWLRIRKMLVGAAFA